MPRRDGTGPIGKGLMTGRCTGLCADFAASGYANSTAFGCRRGFGRKLCVKPRAAHAGCPKYTEQYEADVDEKEFLSKQKESLENKLQQVIKRIFSLDAE